MKNNEVELWALRLARWGWGWLFFKKVKDIYYIIYLLYIVLLLTGFSRFFAKRRKKMGVFGCFFWYKMKIFVIFLLTY